MGSRRTTIINTSTTVAPQQPPAQAVVQSGRISGMPTTYTVGATRRVSPAADYPVQFQPYNPFRTAYNTIPYVPFRPRNVYNPVVRPATPPQTITNTSVSVAGTLKDEVCDAILGDPVSGVDNFTVCGNGKSNRFRFPVAGAPSEIAVTNLTTNVVIDSSEYNVLVRDNSVSWLIFDVAPADGVCFNVKYVIGDSPFIRNVRVGTWTDWLVKLNNLQRQLLSAKSNSQSNQTYRFGYSTVDNRIPESAAYDGAIDAVIQLKGLIKAPGKKMDLKSIEAACNNIEDQLAKINAGTGKRAQVDSTVGGPLVRPPEISRGANIIFEFDDRYGSFSPFGREYLYNGRYYTLQYDNQIKAYYFDLNTGRLPVVYSGYSGTGGGGDDSNDWFNKSKRSGTGVTGGKGGVGPAEKPGGFGGGGSGLAPSTSSRPSERPDQGSQGDYGSGRGTKDDAYGGSAFV